MVEGYYIFFNLRPTSTSPCPLVGWRTMQNGVDVADLFRPWPLRQLAAQVKTTKIIRSIRLRSSTSKPSSWAMTAAVAPRDPPSRLRKRLRGQPRLALSQVRDAGTARRL
jgi:hypothetical protein